MSVRTIVVNSRDERSSENHPMLVLPYLSPPTRFFPFGKTAHAPPISVRYTQSRGEK